VHDSTCCRHRLVSVRLLNLSRFLSVSLSRLCAISHPNHSYMAPELFFSSQYGSAVDIFSIGMLLWEMCTRQLPWSDLAPPLGRKVEQMLLQRKRPLLPENVPEVFRACIQACWSHEPQLRPTAKQLIDKWIPLLRRSLPTEASAVIAQSPLSSSDDVIPPCKKTRPTSMEPMSPEIITWMDFLRTKNVSAAVKQAQPEPQKRETQLSSMLGRSSQPKEGPSERFSLLPPLAADNICSG